jgi:hypothetical protein
MRGEGPNQNLTIGRTYPVEAVEIWSDGFCRYYLHLIEDSEFPYPCPSELFDIVDDGLPDGWCIWVSTGEHGNALKRISFPEWSRDEMFYERLMDGDAEAIRIYMRRRQSARG